MRLLFESALAKFREKEFLASLALFMLPLAILLGPRINLSWFPTGSFRLQDFWVLFVAVLLTAAYAIRPAKAKISLSSLILIFLLFVASITVTVFVFLGDFTIVPFYVLRLLQLPIISVLVCRLLDISGNIGLKATLLAFAVSLVANLLWVLLQLFSDRKGALWFFGGDAVPGQYGPGLIGEPATFPAAQALIIILGGLVSFALSGFPKYGRYGLLLASTIIALAGTILLIQSRISIAVAALYLSLLFAQGLIIRRKPRPVIVTTAAGLSTGTALFLAMSGGIARLNPDGIARGFSARGGIYDPLLQAMEGSFIFGLGLGRGRLLIGGEPHNLFLSVWADVGFLGLLLFLLFWFFLIRYALEKVHSGAGLSRTFAIWALLTIVNLLISGVVQDSHVPVASNHLGAIVLGAFFWLAHRDRHCATFESPIPRLMSKAYLHRGREWAQRKVERG